MITFLKILGCIMATELVVAFTIVLIDDIKNSITMKKMVSTPVIVKNSDKGDYIWNIKQ